MSRMRHPRQTSNPGSRNLNAQAAAARAQKMWFCSISTSLHRTTYYQRRFMFLLGQGYKNGGDPIFKMNRATYSVLHNHEQ